MADEKALPRKPITLAELRQKTAKAEKEATEFEKSPTIELTPGMEIQFRVKKVAEGNFDAPLVIASEVRVGQANGFAVMPVKTYMQDGKDAPKVYGISNPGEDIRIPTFLVKRAKDQDVVIHEKLVYWAKYIGDKEVAQGTFKQGAVVLVGDNFAEA